MATAILMLREFGERLRQVHISDVGAAGEHLPIGLIARVAFSRLAAHVPRNCPVIIESVVESDAIERESAAAMEAFDERPDALRLGARSLVTV
jgi:sugar phosphate isomerase/epimerase